MESKGQKEIGVVPNAKVWDGGLEFRVGDFTSSQVGVGKGDKKEIMGKLPGKSWGGKKKVGGTYNPYFWKHE